MSDWIGHECGIAAVRLLKPLGYYAEKYGTPMYAVNKLSLLMEKQHNRGQDGAGVAAIKLDMPPGEPYIFRTRSADKNPIIQVRNRMVQAFAEAREKHPINYQDAEWVKRNVLFAGELLLGHLRYGTHGASGESFCHPFMRQSNWMTRNLVVAGNFNLTNNDELFDMLVELGQHPRNKADTVMVLEKIGHFLDEANDFLFRKYRKEGLNRVEITEKITKELDIYRVLKKATRSFDGGYVMAGMIGHGDLFALRDPGGIRPAFYYKDDEIVVIASERPQIQTALNVPIESVKEIKPGHALLVKRTGEVQHEEVNKPAEPTQCSFERIYFSRGTDKDIYQERKNLGRSLVRRVLDRVDYDLENTVFSYIPNTAETAFFGLVEGVKDMVGERMKFHLLKEKRLTAERIDELLSFQPRVEKLMTKDAKLRTFITADADREDLVAQVYDTTYGIIKPADTLVVLDDSIVRGTTLRTSILRILDRLGMKKIVVVSSAPQIRFPDCYGIDMSKMKDFVAFEAGIALIRETGREHMLNEIYEACKEDERKPRSEAQNQVIHMFDPFTPDEISDKIAQILTPVGMKAEVQVIYQSIGGLHEACPNHTGDWYFTGNYPTPGGHRVANRSFINFIEKSDARAY
ncbi:amidophosphoribosyltransferase [Pontiella sulfatireligans]|uniref:Amidophosphoribosyltransferase n=1 Tax=Pontiella sulfatireligans TaxID=2750658 RepID=A0A6C2UD53_9BACT|nr:amidophosphoribosyltransferase [Pontiella sulfatireligans]VGO18055.1 Amidophosphoribosyltransferase [Pontiella sulfatireligans]